MIRIEIPSRDTPGFLRRTKKSLELMHRASDTNNDPAVIDELVDFILEYVVEPEDRDKARQELMDATQAQFESIVAQIGGLEQNPTSPNPS